MFGDPAFSSKSIRFKKMVFGPIEHIHFLEYRWNSYWSTNKIYLGYSTYKSRGNINLEVLLFFSL